MKRNGKAVLALGVLAAALIAAGGSAFTNSNSLPQTTTAGYGSTNVTGAQAQSIVYNTSSDGTTVDSVTVVLSAPGSLDYAAGRSPSPGPVVYSIKGGFTRAAQPDPITDDLVECDVATKDALTNTVTCNFTGINTMSTMSFHLLVTNN